MLTITIKSKNSKAELGKVMLPAFCLPHMANVSAEANLATMKQHIQAKCGGIQVGTVYMRGIALTGLNAADLTMIDVEVIPISPNSDLFQCSLLRLSWGPASPSLRVLLDCGWTESMDPSLYAALTDGPEDLVAEIDVVLISHYDLAHCGALPWLLFGKKMKPKKIIATECVKRLGELTLASLHEDWDKVKNVQTTDGSYLLTLEDIVKAFSKGIEYPVQFNEPVVIEATSSVTVTAHPCGRLIGGAYFCITIGTERLVYCVDYSLVGDTHVGGLSGDFAKKAAVVITNGICGDSSAGDKQMVESQLEQLLVGALRQDGSVLLPVDATGRVLELLLLIESIFQRNANLKVYPVVFLSPLGDVILDQIKTRMEWMNKNLLTEFENSVNFSAHPFLFAHVQVESSITELFEKYPPRRPKIVLSTSNSLEVGDSRELFYRFSSDPNNLVLFTQIHGLPEDSWAKRILRDLADGGGANLNHSLTYKEKQLIKTSLPDEQLREVYRVSLEREAQDDELRRRRAREKKIISQAMNAPSSASAVPVDLIRLGANASYEFDLESAGGAFFRPLLFAGQTVASGPILGGNGSTNTLTNPTGATDYGESLNSTEINTWRAHADVSDVGASREATAQAAADRGGVKSELIKGQPKEELNEKRFSKIKGDYHDDEDHKVKGEQGVVSSANESFDWRRDLQTRFGEPKRVEARERAIKIACKIKILTGLDGRAHSVHAREFVSSIKPANLVILPTNNVRETHALAMMLDSKNQQLWSCQRDGPDLFTDSVSEKNFEVVPTPVSFSINVAKKWINIDPSASLRFVPIGPTAKVVLLDEQSIVGPLNPTNRPDLIKAPTGEYIEYVVANTNKSGDKRNSASSTASNIVLMAKPFTISEFAKRIKTDKSDDKDLQSQFVSTSHGRALAVSSSLNDVALVSTGNLGFGDQQVVNVVGVPGPAFYKIRQMLYANALCL